MKTNLTASDLIKFEENVCDAFQEKKILAPIHLDNGNEEQLIHIFENYVNEEDWICCSWRSHYKCLLKNVPQEKIMDSILSGKSISLCFPEHQVVSSAIVGGILPIATGISMGLKKGKVVCFCGDMTAESGWFYESQKYAKNHSLPIIFVIEDNGKSVCTDTKETWKSNKSKFEPDNYIPKSVVKVDDNVLYYKYESKFPHAGVGGARIQF